MSTLKLILARIVFWTGCVIIALSVTLIVTAVGIQCYEAFQKSPSGLAAMAELGKVVCFFIVFTVCIVIWALCGSYIDERKKK